MAIVVKRRWKSWVIAIFYSRKKWILGFFSGENPRKFREITGACNFGLSDLQLMTEKIIKIEPELPKKSLVLVENNWETFASKSTFL